jgi:molybdopterin molybdotransferase
MLSVHPAPRVGILSTGSELVELGEPLKRGQIHDSNSYLLAAAVAQAGGDPVRLGLVPDDEDRFRQMLTDHAGEVDAFLMSGGVSVGAYDVTKAVLSTLGTVRFSAVRMQPGKPQAFGRWTDGTPIFALPGNPVSAFVSFEVFVRPALRRMQGFAELNRPTEQATVLHGWSSPAGRRQFMPVTIERNGPDGSALGIRPATAGGSGSHLVGSLAVADALAIVDETVEQVSVGETLTVMLVES